MKKIKIALLLSIIFVLLAGCSKATAASKFEPKTTSLYVTKDGLLFSATIDDFDKDYYDPQEFKKSVEQEVIDYNTTKAGMSVAYAKDVGSSGDLDVVLPISIEVCQAAEGKATGILAYASIEDYLAYSKKDSDPSLSVTELSILTAAEAAASGILLDDVEFIKPDGSTADNAAIMKDNKSIIIQIKGIATVQTEGKIQYISKNVTKMDDKTVTCSDGDVSYIIFK